MSLDFLKDKSIIVTGGTGSFGQYFVKYLLDHSQAQKIIIFSRDELKQSRMLANLANYKNRLRFFLGDVRDYERLRRAFCDVDYVIHAAALKQVPALEYNPFEAVKTNIVGTENVINAALDQGVKKMLLISTDKAANPSNLYGASKLCAEKLVISGNAYSGHGGTRLGVVRYGNVFGSRGSLIEVIKQQKPNGYVTLTHTEMTRFWITLEQSIALVLMSLEKMFGGEVFIPKIPSMRIIDLIKNLAPTCRIEVIGIRPGEKLHEILMTHEEARHAKEYDNYYVILPEHDWWEGHKYYTDGKQLRKDFCLVSNESENWLTNGDIEKLFLSL